MRKLSLVVAILSLLVIGYGALAEEAWIWVGLVIFVAAIATMMRKRSPQPPSTSPTEARREDVFRLPKP